MEIRFRTKEHLDALNNGDIESFPIGYLEDLVGEIVEDKNRPDFKAVDYAMGPDYVWIYAALAGIAHVIAFGEQINNGFEGWAKLAKNINKLIRKTEVIALDKDALSVLCVNKLLELQPEVQVIKKTIEYEVEIPGAYGYGGECEYSKFIEKAQIYYVQGYEVNEKRLVIFGARENGEIEILKQIDIVKYR